MMNSIAQAQIAVMRGLTSGVISKDRAKGPHNNAMTAIVICGLTGICAIIARQHGIARPRGLT